MLKTRCASFLTVLLFFAGILAAHGQATFETQVGVSYIEHLSIGAGIQFSNKHSISFLYGSNFFIRPKNFASYLIQYKFTFDKLAYKNMLPGIGLKGGTNIYTDDYYRWNVVSIIPFIELQYPISDHVKLFLQGGCAFSLEQSVTRIKDGEIGHYKDLLPECKTGVLINLSRK